MSGKTIALIGAGIFGCTIALRLSEFGYKVILLERESDILMSTSSNNTNRIHQGFHYPRDEQTARDCRDSYQRFECEFGDALLDKHPAIYGIASERSLTTKQQFLTHCFNLKLDYTIVNPKHLGLDVKGCEFYIWCNESVLDSNKIRKILIQKIKGNDKIELFLNSNVNHINKLNNKYYLYITGKSRDIVADAVINCSYASINTLTEKLGFDVDKRQYEYTVTPIIYMDMIPTSITIMDGPFVSLLPFNKPKHFVLYHVDNSVVHAEISKKLNSNWLNPKKSPFANVDKDEYFEDMVWLGSKFIPELKNAKLRGWLEAPRMVLSGHEKDDARPSFINDYGNGYMTVFSGKLDRCLDISDQVCFKLNNFFK